MDRAGKLYDKMRYLFEGNKIDWSELDDTSLSALPRPDGMLYLRWSNGTVVKVSVVQLYTGPEIPEEPDPEDDVRYVV